MTTTPPPEPAWRRVHRVTPLLTAWRIAAALVAIALFQAFDDLARTPLPGLVLVGIVAGFIVLASLVSLGYSYLAWRRLSYAITADAVVLRNGVVFRRERVARLTRIQSVEVTQPILGRIFGFAALRIESAGAGESALQLAYLTQAEATAVRNEVLARAAGIEVGIGPEHGSGLPPEVEAGTQVAAPAGGVVGADGPMGVPSGGPLGLPGSAAGSPPARGEAGSGTRAAPSGIPAMLIPEAPEHQVFQLAASRLLVSLLLHGATLALLLAGVAIVVIGLVSGTWEFLFGTIAGLLAGVGFLWSRFSSEFAFRVATSPDGLRVRHGLLETKARTIPPGRIQSVQLVQGPLWRALGWWRVRLALATGPSTDGAMPVATLLPVGTPEEALRLVRLALPGLGAEEVPALVAGMTGTGGGEGWVPAPRRSRWLDPISYRRNAFRVLGVALALRRGRISRQLTLVPHERTQSLGVQQGPFDRWFDLVSFHPHTSGLLVTQLPHLDPPVAAVLVAEQSERARAARRSAGPEMWMRGARDSAPS